MDVVTLEFNRNGIGRGRGPAVLAPRWVSRWPDPSRVRLAPLPPRTDFSTLVGKRVLCLVDDDNLRISLQRHAVRLSYSTLLARLKAATRALSPWAVLTGPDGDTKREVYLRVRGWNVLAIPQVVVMTVYGLRRRANADMDMCFEAGYLARSGGYDAVIVGSGDGDLCIAIARGFGRMHAGCEVYTLSIPGCTSHRLRVGREAHLFAGNLLVGRELTRGLLAPSKLACAFEREDTHHV